MRCGLRSGPARCAPIPPRSRRWRWWGRCWGTGARCPKTGPRPALSAPSVWHRIHPPSMLKRRRHRLNRLRPRHDERQSDPDEHRARRAHRVVRARRLCARGAGDSAAGGAVPRPLRRGHPQGRELCLRPDLTIPVSRDYLASPAAGKPRGFCYLGPVFRHRAEGGGEFLQAGIESFGRPDTAAADAEMLALGLDATAHYGVGAPDIRIGDIALFSALVAALDLAPAWKRRLIKDFNHKTSLAHDLDRL